jgi:diacylglycerol kinase (ATP)
MPGNKKIFFIINPRAGSGKTVLGENLAAVFHNTDFTADFIYTKHRGHAYELSQKAAAEGYDAVIAVGGDGTINETGRGLMGSNSAMGIVPRGSGNGLARHHKIPLDIRGALEVIKCFHLADHDAVKINEFFSFNVSGIGFDAHVAFLFGKDGKRGFSNYLRLVIKEFPKYREHQFKIESMNRKIISPGFFVSISNGSQFGNNARIAPDAVTNDGKADLTLVRRMSGWKMPFFAMKVFNSTVKSSPFAETDQAAQFVIESDTDAPLHIDGEPAGYSKTFQVNTISNALKLIIPGSYVE